MNDSPTPPPSATHKPGMYRRKPTVLEAWQWSPEAMDAGEGVHYDSSGAAYVDTAHDQRVYLSSGDWILPEPMPGRFYPCKPDIFAATYDLAVAPPAALTDDERGRVCEPPADGFNLSYYTETLRLLLSGNDAVVSAALSNNFNTIISALRIAIQTHTAAEAHPK